MGIVGIKESDDMQGKVISTQFRLKKIIAYWMKDLLEIHKDWTFGFPTFSKGVEMDNTVRFLKHV